MSGNPSLAAADPFCHEHVRFARAVGVRDEPDDLETEPPVETRRVVDDRPD